MKALEMNQRVFGKLEDFSLKNNYLEREIFLDFFHNIDFSQASSITSGWTLLKNKIVPKILQLSQTGEIQNISKKPSAQGDVN